MRHLLDAVVWGYSLAACRKIGASSCGPMTTATSSRRHPTSRPRSASAAS